MTQVQVAAAANMSQSYYAEIERGQKRLNYDTMTAIAAAFGVSPQELLEHSSDMEEAISGMEMLSADDFAAVRDLIRRLLASTPRQR